MQVTVHYNKLLVAPRKLRAVLTGLRRKAVPEAIALMFASNRTTTEPIRKLLLASISAAHDRNPALRPEQLAVEEIYCNESVRQYRTRRKSRGRSARYAKRGSHLTLVVSWSDSATPVAKKTTVKSEATNKESGIRSKGTPKVESRKSKVTKSAASTEGAPSVEGAPTTEATL